MLANEEILNNSNVVGNFKTLSEMHYISSTTRSLKIEYNCISEKPVYVLMGFPELTFSVIL